VVAFASLGAQVPVGSPVLASVHPWHANVHAVPQQTASAWVVSEQAPVMHWSLAEHIAPITCCAVHVPDAQ
jgi:hypothetical protein